MSCLFLFGPNTNFSLALFAPKANSLTLASASPFIFDISVVSRTDDDEDVGAEVVVVDVVDDDVEVEIGVVFLSCPSCGGSVTVMTLFSGLRVFSASWSASRLLKSTSFSVEV